MKNKTVIYQYEDEIHYSVGKRHLDRARNAVNKNFFGNMKPNILCDETGYYKDNPKLDKHPKRQECREAHWHLNASQVIRVHVKVYSDGTTEIVPIG